MVQLAKFAILGLLVPSWGFRTRHSKRYDSCQRIGCGTAYNRSLSCQCNDRCGDYGNCCNDFGPLCEGSSDSCDGKCGAAYDGSLPCQCNDQCARYGNCCSDHGSLCGGSPNPGPVPGPSPTPSSGPLPTPPAGPAPGPPGQGAVAYWAGVDMSSKSAISSRLNSGATSLSYSGLWSFYKEGWVNLPGGCQGGVNDVYSTKCWTPGSGQCGTYKREGDCYNREHSWPKSWWGGGKNTAYTDLFHVMPSDGYVNGRRSSHAFGEVNSPTYTSSEGNKVGSCSSPGISGTCFEPTDRVKGLLARGNLYVNVRYGYSIKNGAAGVDLLLRWSAAHPPQAWEIEFNNRGQEWQKNRNPFIDFPQAAQDVFR